MPDKLHTVRVTLSDGRERNLAGGSSAEEAVARLIDLEKGEGEFAGDWCQTQEGTMIAKAHIIEAHAVPL